MSINVSLLTVIVQLNKTTTLESTVYYCQETDVPLVIIIFNKRAKRLS